MNILIIDDDPEDTMLFCEALRELDPHATCHVAHSCENIHASSELIAIIDIIFVDGYMHPIGGKACLLELIKVVDRSKTTIIIHSGSVSPEEKTNLEKIGADHILIKTSSYEQLKSNISEILSNHSKIS